MQTDPNTYNSGFTLSPIKIPLLGDIPIIGQALFDVNIIVYMTYALVVRRRRRRCSAPAGACAPARSASTRRRPTPSGIKVRGTRYRNVIIGGLIAGLAGADADHRRLRAFNANISSGKGFIALAAVIFGRWSPRGAVAAALLFGFTDELQNAGRPSVHRRSRSRRRS